MVGGLKLALNRLRLSIRQSGFPAFFGVAVETQVPVAQTRALVRERMVSGRLPRLIPEKLYAGRGSSTRCAVCSQPITPQQIEYEVAISASKWLVFHMQCHNVWLAECRDHAAVPTKDGGPHCRQCEALLAQYTNAVESFSLAVKNYWSDGKAGSRSCAAQTERRLTAEDLTGLRTALMNHYAACENHRP
jgi:hypothetical protein